MTFINSNSTEKKVQYTYNSNNKFRFEYPELFTKRLKLRQIRRSDRKAIFDYCSQPETSEQVSWGVHTDLEDTDRFINNILDDYHIL